VALLKACNPKETDVAVVQSQNVGQVLMSVDDVDRQVAFYMDVLGLPLLFRVPGTDMAFFNAGTFRLYVDKWYDGAPVSRPLLYFTVPSVPEAHEALLANGVRPADPPAGVPHVINRTETSELWMSFLYDPEDTMFALMADVSLA
jgi:catechol 2,3-dioxygenase-like lactoylglutathione lyase family enzyme